MAILTMPSAHKTHFAALELPSAFACKPETRLALVKKASGKFDIIFIDVDKHQYPDALRAALPKLKRGGLLITDNTLWSGKAARPAPADDKNTLGIQEFNRLVYASKELYPVLIPMRDGVTVAQKL